VLPIAVGDFGNIFNSQSGFDAPQPIVQVFGGLAAGIEAPDTIGRLPADDGTCDGDIAAIEEAIGKGF
jgi:hypothetical protein